MKKKEEGINVELLLEIKENVLKYPRHVDMGSYLYIDDGLTDEYSPVCMLDALRDGKCDSTGCVSGWASQLHNAKKGTRKVSAVDGEIPLRLNLQQCDELFYAGSWPDKFRDQYYNAKTPRGRARAVANRIDAFIKQYAQEAT